MYHEETPSVAGEMNKCKYYYLVFLVDFSLALHFQDWSRKFVKPFLLGQNNSQQQIKYTSVFYDPQWAFHIMDRKRDYKPNIDRK